MHMEFVEAQQPALPGDLGGDQPQRIGLAGDLLQAQLHPRGERHGNARGACSSPGLRQEGVHDEALAAADATPQVDPEDGARNQLLRPRSQRSSQPASWSIARCCAGSAR